MARILVIGASGLLGAELVLTASENHDVVAVSNRHPLNPPARVVALTADLTQPGIAAQLIADHRPAWVINAAAATEVDALEDHPDRADAANRTLPADLAVASRDAGV